MKRSIILFAAVLLVMVGWSQTMTINFKDGSVVNQNVSTITSFEITENNENQGGDDTQGENQEIKTLIVGTWKENKEKSSLRFESIGISYIQFNTDGTWFSVKLDEEKGNSISKGRWHVYGDSIIVNTKEGIWTFCPIVWTIKNVGANELLLTQKTSKAYLTKVTDRDIERYLPSDFNRTFYCKGSYDCMENNTLLINGKSYCTWKESTVYESSGKYGNLYINITPYEEGNYYHSIFNENIGLTIGGSGGYVHNYEIGKEYEIFGASFRGKHSYSQFKGNITVLEITDYFLTIQLNDVQMDGLSRIYNGVVVLKNDKGNGKPFDKPND